MRPHFAVCFALALICTPAAALAQSQPLSVEVDHTSRIDLAGAAASVVVGNPEIADVTVVDANTLFVSGRGYGVTEIVVLDAYGRTLFQREVVVSAPSSGQVRVWRGGAVTDMACGATCAPTARNVTAGAGLSSGTP